MSIASTGAGIMRAQMSDLAGIAEPVIFTLNDDSIKPINCTVIRNANQRKEWAGGDTREEHAVVHVSDADDATGIADASTIKTLEFEDGKIFQVEMPTSSQGDGSHVLDTVDVTPGDRFQPDRVY